MAFTLPSSSLLNAAAALPAEGFVSTSLRELASHQQSPEQNAPAWPHPTEFDLTRWDQRFPYQLLVVEQRGKTYQKVSGWQFTLPIPPEALRVQMPFASTANVSLDGIVEEHAGAPVRMLYLQGTTGVLPFRPSADHATDNTVLKNAASVFAGAVENFRATAASAFNLANTLSGGRPAVNLLTDQQRSEQEPLSGYAQFHLLKEFLENYAEFRRTTAGRGKVLAFCSWKDQTVWLVTPVSFDLDRNAARPLEYPYSLSFKAWRRVELTLDSGRALKPDPAPRRDPALLAAVLNTLRDARRVLQGARNTLSAVGGDVDHLLHEPLREVTLLVKDLNDVSLGFDDLNAQVFRDAREPLLRAYARNEQVADPKVLSRSPAARASQDALRALADQHVRGGTRVDSGVGGSPGRLSLAVTGGGTAQTAAGRAPVPATDVFDRPQDHFELLSAIPLGRVPLPARTQAAVAAERLRVSRLGRSDLETRRQGILAVAARLADAVGGGDPTFSATYGLPVPPAAAPLSRSTLRIIHALNGAVLAIARLAAYGAEAAEASVLSGLEQVAGRAAASGVAFRVPTSKFPVPFPYGGTLERLSAAYLGTPDRWHEIAALNGLRAPYVDETGWSVPLLAPGRDATVVVADDGPPLHVGQVVWVGSAGVPRTKRRVLGIAATPGQLAVTLDGDPTLDAYTTVSGAVLQGFLPGTVNSQSLVFIPSDLPPDGAFRTTGVPEARTFDALTAAGGVDLLLTPSNDLVVTPDGDARWAVGLTNLIQRFRILLTLKRGTLLHHPEVGLGVGVGTTNAEVSVADVASAVRAALAAEPGFRSVNAVSLQMVGNTVSLSVDAKVSGTDLSLPLSVQLP